MRSTFLSALMAMLAVGLAMPALAPAIPVPDLDVTMSRTPDPVAAGSDITYTLTLQNIGTGSATTVELGMALPAGTTFRSLSQSAGAGFACTTPAVDDTGTATCTSATVLSGATATFSLVLRADASLSAGTVITATATAAADTDADSTNNSASASTTIATPPPGPSAPPVRPRPVPTWGISQNHGPVTGGTLVVIQGIKFGGVTEVRFGATPAQFTVDNFNQITAIAPPHEAGTVPITMLRGVWSNPDEWMMFTYDAVAPEPSPPAAPAPPPAPSACVVPDLRGHTLHGARVLLKRAGCALGHVRRATPRRGAARVRVARQGAKPGTRLEEGGRVTIVLRALPARRH